jgi:hypothetical protein
MTSANLAAVERIRACTGAPVERASASRRPARTLGSAALTAALLSRHRQRCLRQFTIDAGLPTVLDQIHVEPARTTMTTRRSALCVEISARHSRRSEPAKPVNNIRCIATSTVTASRHARHQISQHFHHLAPHHVDLGRPTVRIARDLGQNTQLLESGSWCCAAASDPH